MISFNKIGIGLLALAFSTWSAFSMTDKVKIPETWTIEYKVTKGAGHTPEFPQYLESVTVDMAAAKLSAKRWGSDYDQEIISPIGFFEKDLSAQEIKDLRQLAHDSFVLASEPDGTGKMARPPAPGVERKLELRSPAVTRGFTPAELDTPSVSKLVQWLGSNAFQAPAVAALDISATYDRKTKRFSMRLHNPGTKKICFRNPQSLPSNRKETGWAAVLVAVAPDEKSGVTSAPIEWKTVPLQKDSNAASSVMELEADAKVEFSTQIWEPDGKDYLFRSLYSHYVQLKDCKAPYRIIGTVGSEIQDLSF